MKKLTTLIVSILALSLAFTSCKKEEETPSMFTLNGIDHETDHGYIYTYANTSTTSISYILLCSPEMDFSETDGYTGYGDLVLLGFMSNSVDELLSGTYTYSGTFYAGLMLNYDEDLETGISYSISSSGSSSADVTVSGDTYEIEYSVYLETGKTLTGYYKGTLEEISSMSFKSLPVSFSE